MSILLNFMLYVVFLFAVLYRLVQPHITFPLSLNIFYFFPYIHKTHHLIHNIYIHCNKGLGYTFLNLITAPLPVTSLNMHTRCLLSKSVVDTSCTFLLVICFECIECINIIKRLPWLLHTGRQSTARSPRAV